jgi:hypothetical protein
VPEPAHARVEEEVREDAQRSQSAAAAPAGHSPAAQMLALQRSAGNRAARATAGGAPTAVLARKPGKGEKRHKALVAELKGRASEDYVADLHAAMIDAHIGRLSANYAEILDALMNARRQLKTKDAVVDAYKRLTTDINQQLAASPDSYGLQISTDLTFVLKTTTGSHPAATRSLMHVLETGEFSRLDELRLALGALTHKNRFLWQDWGDLKRAMAILETTPWTEDEVKAIRSDDLIRKAFWSDSSAKQFFVAWDAYTSGRSRPVDSARRRDEEIEFLAARLRPLLLDTEHSFRRHRQTTTQFDAMAAIVRAWIPKADLATRRAAIEAGSPLIKLLREGGIFFTRALSQSDADYLVALIANSVIGTGGTDVGTEARTFAGGGLVQGTKLDVGALTDKAEKLAGDPLAANDDRDRAEELKGQAELANTAAGVKSMIDREIGKARDHGIAQRHSKHKRLIEAIYALEPKQVDALLAFYDTDRKKALEKLGAELKSAKVGSGHRAMITAKLRTGKKELSDHFRKLAKMVAERHDRTRTKSGYTQDVLSVLTKMTPEELIEVRRDNELVTELLDGLERGWRYDHIEALIGRMGSATTAALTEDEATKRSRAIEHDPQYWADLIEYEFRKHETGLKGDVGRRTRVNIHKLAGIVQRAIWAMRDGGQTPDLVFHTLSPGRQKDLAAKSPTLHKHLRDGTDLPTEYRLKKARRGIATHDQEIEEILEQTPDKHVLREWSNASELFDLFKRKAAARGNADDKELKSIMAEIDEFVLDIKPGAYDLVWEELHSLFGKSSRLVGVENKVRARIAQALGHDTEFNKLVLDNAISPADRQIMGERLLALGSIRSEHLARTGIQHGIGWRKLDVLATERKVAFSLLTAEHRGIKEQLETETGRFLEQGEGASPERRTILKDRLGKLRDRRNVYESVRQEFSAARAKYNQVIKTIIHIAVAAVVTGLTAGITGPVSLGAAILISLVNSAASVGVKAFDFGVDFLLEGGADISTNELVRGLVRNLVIEPGIKVLTSMASFGLRDVMPSLAMSGHTEREVYEFDPLNELKAQDSDDFLDTKFSAELLGKTRDEIIKSQLVRSVEMAGYRALEAGIQKGMEDTAEKILSTAENVIEHHTLGRTDDWKPDVLEMGRDYINTMLSEAALNAAQSMIVLRVVEEAWGESESQNWLDAVGYGEDKSWTEIMKTDAITTPFTEGRAALEEGMPETDAEDFAEVGTSEEIERTTVQGTLKKLHDVREGLEKVEAMIKAREKGTALAPALANLKAEVDRRLQRINKHITTVEEGVRLGTHTDQSLVKARRQAAFHRHKNTDKRVHQALAPAKKP